MNPNNLRENNRVSFDSMIMVDMAESEENIKAILKEWQKYLERTEFYISTNVIKETYGVLAGKKHFDTTDARKKIDEIKVMFKMKELQYNKEIDNKEGFKLFREAEQKFPEVAFKDPQHLINDSRIIAHLKREGINIVYSREEMFRNVAKIAGLEARDFIRDISRKKSQ